MKLVSKAFLCSKRKINICLSLFTIIPNCTVQKPVPKLNQPLLQPNNPEHSFEISGNRTKDIELKDAPCNINNVEEMA